MTKNIDLIVTDSSPLITLAVAGRLNVLLLPQMRVVIPDMVRYEVIHDAGKPGATEVLEWIRQHEGKKLFIGSSQTFEEFQRLLLTSPNTKFRNRGEQAAGEVLQHELEVGNADIAILLFEDSDLTKANFLGRIPDNVLIMSTSEYLDGLEKQKLIASATEILDKAVDAGRAEHVKNRSLRPTDGAEEARHDWPRRTPAGRR